MSDTEMGRYLPPEAINGMIQELEAKAVMNLPKKPNNETTPEQMMEYRSQLATRHLRESLGKRNGVYSSGKLDSLNGTMIAMVDSRHPDFKKLYNDVAKKLTEGGAKVDDFLTNVTEEQMKEIAEIIAASNVPIIEETSKERYMHSLNEEWSKDYVARDSTIEEEISKLQRQLPE